MKSLPTRLGRVGSDGPWSQGPVTIIVRYVKCSAIEHPARPWQDDTPDRPAL